MRKNLLLPVMILIGVIQFSCKKKETPVQLYPKEFQIDIQRQYETLPSKVSVFFRVKDENDNPVSGLTSDNFTIYEKGRNDDAPKVISEDEAVRIISDNEQVFDYKVLLLLDLSGSVINGNLDQLKEAAKEFVIDVMQADMNSSTKIGIWWFDGADQLHPLIDFTNNSIALQEAILGINSGISNDSSTDLFGAIIKATTLAETELSTSQLEGSLSAASVIMFTDGTDQAARYTKEDAYEQVNNAANDINYYSIGLGNEIDEDVLRNIGKSSSVFAEDSDSLTAKFEEIAQIIHDETNSFYLFEYCTPKRDGSGENELIIEVTKDDRQGSKTTVFDATGFESGCSLN